MDGPKFLLMFALGLKMRLLVGLLVLLWVAGCTESKPTAETPQDPPAPAAMLPPVVPDDADAVQVLESLNAKLKRNDDGLIVEVNLRDTEADDDTLKSVAALNAVTSLLLNDRPITNKGLAHLTSWKSPIANLDLRGCPVGNAGLKHIAGKKTLKALRLNGTSGKTTVDDDGMVHLKGLTNLKVLAFDGLYISEDGLQELSDLSRMEELYMKMTVISDEGLAVLKQFPKLKKLRLAANQIGEEGLAQLSDMATLEELDLSENEGIRNEALLHLAGLTGLKKLNLWRVHISDDGVAHLADLTNMTWLNLDNTEISDAALPSLAKMGQLVFLHLGSTRVSDAGLKDLAGLTTLQDLKLTRTAVTEAGATKLQESLPDTNIQLVYLEGQ